MPHHQRCTQQATHGVTCTYCNQDVPHYTELHSSVLRPCSGPHDDVDAAGLGLFRMLGRQPACPPVWFPIRSGTPSSCYCPSSSGIRISSSCGWLVDVGGVGSKIHHHSELVDLCVWIFGTHSHARAKNEYLSLRWKINILDRLMWRSGRVWVGWRVCRLCICSVACGCVLCNVKICWYDEDLVSRIQSSPWKIAAWIHL